METLLERICNHYQITKEEYEKISLPPSFSNLPLLDEDPIVKKAIEHLSLMRDGHKKVLVYGDYDTDGVMSTSILVRSFREFGIDVSGYLPSRYLDGYGLTAENVRKIAKNGYSMIFTCDNGVTAHEALQTAKEEGIEVIILDHHEFDSLSPETDLVIHPLTTHYGEVAISAGYLSFIFSHALLGRYDEYLMCLGAISTISDMMPFREYNREIVRLMLETVKKNRYFEIVALTDKESIDETTFQMEIVPKINSVGRLEKGTTINRLIHYFADPMNPQKEKIAEWINKVNENRKSITKEGINGLDFNPNDAAIVVLTSLPEGLNGLLASRLLSQFQKPIAVFSPTEKNPDVLVASLRSQEGFNILEALEESKVRLLTKGGHPFAGGCSLQKQDFERFKKDFIFLALKHKLAPKNTDGIEIYLNECNMKSYRLLKTFSPFGLEWEAPKFILRGLNPTTFTYTRDGKYLSTKLSPDTRLFSFSLNEDSFEMDQKVDLLLTFKLNEFKGKVTLDLIAERAI